jgi:hypothetical protein
VVPAVVEQIKLGAESTLVRLHRGEDMVSAVSPKHPKLYSPVLLPKEVSHQIRCVIAIYIGKNLM